MRFNTSFFNALGFKPLQFLCIAVCFFAGQNTTIVVNAQPINRINTRSATHVVSCISGTTAPQNIAAFEIAPEFSPAGAKLRAGEHQASWIFAPVLVPSALENSARTTPFVCVSIALETTHADASNITIAVRTEEPNGTFGQWRTLHEETHEAPAQGSITSGLLFAPPDVRRVQVKLTVRRTALNANPLLKTVRIHFFAPGHTPPETPSTSVNAGKTSSEGSIQSATPSRPNFITRTSWGCPWGQTSGPNTLTPTTPTHLIVHHSFSPGNNITDWAAAVRGVWNAHVNSNGWSDIGYNWLIDPNGAIYQGRAWVGDNDNTQGAHFCGFNGGTMGVCMLGDFNSIRPSEAAQRALVRLLGYRAAASSIDPLGIRPHPASMRTLNTISGHRDGCATDCPGDMQYPMLPTYRNRVFAYLNPPTVFDSMHITPQTRSVMLQGMVQSNGSETQAYFEWWEASAVLPAAPTRGRTFTISATTPTMTVNDTLNGVQVGRSYVVRLRAQNSDTSAVSRMISFPFGVTSVQGNTSFETILFGSTPNPCSDEARISYMLGASSTVTLRLYDGLGRLMTTIVQEQQQAGFHEARVNTSALANGVYYCQLRTENFHQMRTLLILK